MNQGLYHPSLNPNGSAKALGDTFWYNTAQSFTTTADCFNPAKLLAGSGSIASGKSGRPSGENQYFDAIYASGFGGVCRDMRYSANGLTPTDFAEADQRVKNGTYRGFEKAVFTHISAAQSDMVVYSGTSQRLIIPNSLATILTRMGLANSDKIKDTAIRFYVESKGGLITAQWYNPTTMTVDFYTTGTTVPLITTGKPILVTGLDTTSSIGGSFLQTDVIGNPSNILATPQLANGWQGGWGGLSSGGGVSKSGARKMIASGLLTYSSDNGATWGTGQLPQPNAENVVTSTYGETEIRICQYQAFAKQTRPSANAAVYGGKSGVGEIYAVNGYSAIDWAALLGESLAGLIVKSTANNTLRNLMPLADVGFDLRFGTLRSDIFNATSHAPLTISAPANSSPAFKALSYNVAVNQQGFINYAYTELKHNGANWGDDGKVTIVDNQSTKTDLNGNTVLVGTAQICEPLGFLKNKL